MPPAYCETSDVQAALQEASSKFGSNELSTGNVEAAIHGVSAWFRNRSKSHFYDSGGVAGDLVDTTTASATNIPLSVPSSPHPQSGQIRGVNEGTITHRYPKTHTGSYVRVKLPRRFVSSIDKLLVADQGGDTTDWVADSGFVEGRGEDYYLLSQGMGNYGRSHLYIHAGALGPHLSFEDVLTVDLSYGLDYQDSAWDSVERGVAALAGAQLVADDDVLAGLPQGANLVGVDTQVTQLVNQALGVRDGVGGYLSPWLVQAVE